MKILIGYFTLIKKQLRQVNSWINENSKLISRVTKFK